MKKTTIKADTPHYIFKNPNYYTIGAQSFAYYKNFLDKKELSWIEEYAKTLHFRGATTGGIDETPNNNPDKRKSKTGWITYNLDTQTLYDKIFESAANNPWGFDVTGIHDALQYTLYPADIEDSYYHSHRDAGLHYWYRKVSMTIQLSDPGEFEGGGFEIEDPGGDGEWISTPHIQKGDMIMFPSILRHRALPVTGGLRKSLVVWVSGPPLR